MNDDRSIVACFQADLAYGESFADEPAWGEYYSRVFPNLAYTAKVSKDGVMQRSGIDRVVHLSNGHILTVDEKKRRGSWTDVLVEQWSDLERKKRGWSMDLEKVCDYVAYAIPKKALCYLLPFPLFRAACLHHEDEWFRAYWHERYDVQNKSWVTRNFPVSWDVVRAAICRQMARRYSGEIDLPTPHRVSSEGFNGQLTFSYGSITPMTTSEGVDDET